MQRFSYDFAPGRRRFPNKRSRPSYLCMVSLNCISASPAALNRYLAAVPAMSLIPFAPLLEELLVFLLAAFGGEAPRINFSDADLYVGSGPLRSTAKHSAQVVIPTHPVARDARLADALQWSRRDSSLLTRQRPPGKAAFRRWSSANVGCRERCCRSA